MKRISLTQGKFALVDDEDYAVVSQFKWHTMLHHGIWYAKRSIFRYGQHCRSLRMHQIIMKPKRGQQIDHINHDGLDNRRKNLRVCTVAQQQQHKRIPSTNTSGFKGVRFESIRGKFISGIKVNGIHKSLGQFDEAITAARVYDIAAIKYHGQFAMTNKMLGLL